MLLPRFSWALMRRSCLSRCGGSPNSSSSYSIINSNRNSNISFLGIRENPGASFYVPDQHRRFFHAEDSPPSSDKAISFSFVESDGKETNVQVPEGVTVLEAAHSNDVPLEGSCEGQCSCSTCHVILSDDLYEALPEPSPDEDDMLDLAACLTDTSRLGCQIRVSKKFQDQKIRLPAITRNFFVDGHKPSPH